MQGTVIDERYTLAKPLGGGGMARVYLAHDEVLDREVAVKVLREQYADDEEFVERFRREARSAASLSHPNIVSVYDQGRSEDGAYYMAMEYVPKGTLKDRIRRDGALAPDAAVGVAIQISDALQAAHSKGVIHRDIKPQNVLVTDVGDTKVADFGIARASSATRVTRTGHVMGTAGYMSPEQAKGDPVGPRSDLYSLGVVLYEMLTGNLPYEADSALVQAMKHANEPPPSPREANPEVSEALDALTMKLLSKNPEDRYASASVLAEDLERVRSGLPPATASSKQTEATTEAMTAPLPLVQRQRRTAPRPPVAAPEHGGRRRLFPILAALIFVTLLGGLAWTLMQSLNEPGSSNSQEGSTADEESSGVVEVPPLYWSTDVETDLANADLTLGSRYEVSSDTVAVDLVVYSDPAVGTRVERDTAVDVFVSTGPEQTPVAPTPAPNPNPPGGVAPVPPAQPPVVEGADQKEREKAVRKEEREEKQEDRQKGKGKKEKEKTD